MIKYSIVEVLFVDFVVCNPVSKTNFLAMVNKMYKKLNWIIGLLLQHDGR